MKKIFTLIALIASVFCVNAQSATISPSEGSALCPRAAITFTVTLPFPLNTVKSNSVYVYGQSIQIPTSKGTYSTVVPFSSCCISAYTSALSNTATQFTFSGIFQDNSTPQTFRVEVDVNDPNSGPEHYQFDFTFTKILSFNPQYLQLETVNPTTNNPISAQICTSNTYQINFAKVNLYGNNWIYNDGHTTPQINLAGVTTYQCLLPTGWSIGSQVSDGTNWIKTTYNGSGIAVTSDLTHGVNGIVQIMPINACGDGLLGGPIYTIPIIRSNPVLTITTPTGINELCSGTKTFTVNGALANSTYSWAISPTSLVTIPVNSTSSSVTVTKVGASGVATLTVNATSCLVSTAQQKILVGGPSGEVTTSVSNLTNCQNGNFVILPSAQGSPTTFNGTVIMADQTGVATSYTWRVYGTNQSGITWIDNGGGSVSVLSKVSKPGILVLDLTASNSCGPYIGYYYFMTVNCNQVVQGANPTVLNGNSTQEADGNSSDQQVKIYPNPVKNTITINLPGDVAINNAFIKISDAYGRKIKRVTLTANSSNVIIQELAPGTYFIELYNNQKLVTVKKIVKN